MDFRYRGRDNETFEEMRERLIAETSMYLTECLKHPELMVNIPSVPADKARFPASFSASFWDSILLE